MLRVLEFEKNVVIVLQSAAPYEIILKVEGFYDRHVNSPFFILT